MFKDGPMTTFLRSTRLLGLESNWGFYAPFAHPIQMVGFF